MTMDGRSMRERTLAGDLYIADDPELARHSDRAQLLCHRHNTMDPTDSDGRHLVLRELPGAFGADSEIRPPFRCDYGYQTFVGARTFANFGFLCLKRVFQMPEDPHSVWNGASRLRRRRLDVATITIGDDVQMGPNVQLLTPTHPVEAGPRRDNWEAAQPIVIGDNVWLGGGVIICPEVTIGANTVVGAGAVVVRFLPADVVAVGNPARVIRQL